MTFKSGAMIAATVATMLTGIRRLRRREDDDHDTGDQVRGRQLVLRHERMQSRRQERVPGHEPVRRHGVHHHRDAGRVRRGAGGGQARGRGRPHRREPGPERHVSGAGAGPRLRPSRAPLPGVIGGGVRGVDFVEAVTENFLGRGGRPRAVLERVRRDVPVALHGVSLSIGGVSPLNRDYLAPCARSVTIGPRSFRTTSASAPGVHTTATISGRCRTQRKRWPTSLPASRTVQDLLGRRLALENVSSYVAFADSQLSEWEFLSEVARRADCDLLLDINNVYVSAYNHGFDRGAVHRRHPDRSRRSVSPRRPSATRERTCSTITARWSRQPSGRCTGAPSRDSGRPRRSSNGTKTFRRSTC